MKMVRQSRRSIRHFAATDTIHEQDDEMLPEFLKKNRYNFIPPDPFIIRKNRKPLSCINAIICCAGYGKTAYLSQLSQEIPNAVCISLGMEDNDENKLAELLTGAVGEESSNDSFHDICRFAEYAVNNHSTLLLDNGDLITSQAAVSLMKILVQAANDGLITIVTAGRKAPAFLLDSIVADKANLLGIDDLRFSRQEIEEMSVITGFSGDELWLNSVYSYTCGWCIATVQLMTHEHDKQLPEDIIGSSFLPEYTRSNIAYSLSDDLREFLLMSSFIPCKDSDFAAAVFGIKNYNWQLGELKRLGITLDGTLPDAVRHCLSPLLDDNKKNELTDRAAVHYIHKRQFAEAVRLLDISGKMTAVEGILHNYGMKFLENYEFELIGYCGNMIEKNGGTSDPETLGILAQYYYYSGDYAQMERSYNMADSMFGKKNKFAVFRQLYNGLIRYETKRGLYSDNIINAVEYLKDACLSLPFLHQSHKSLLDSILNGKKIIEQDKCLIIERFGGLHLYAENAENELQFKTRKCGELMAFLLENSDRNVQRKDILEMFWPDEMPMNAVAMLHNIIYNLRRELSGAGLENVLCYKNKNYYLDMEHIKLRDSDIISACQAAENVDMKTLIALEDNFKTYWGRFLGDLDSIWAAERQEYFDRCFVNGCMLLSEYHRDKKEYDMELQLLKNIQKLDPYSEQTVHSMLLCYFALGKPDKAKRCYEEYEALLGRELGTAPGKWLKKEFLSCFMEGE